MKKQNGLFKKLSIMVMFLFVLSILIPSTVPNLFTTKTAEASTLLNKSSVEVVEGAKTKLSVLGTKKTIVWKSNNKKIATVSQSGNIKGIKAGSTKVTATIGKTILTCDVRVVKYVENEPDLSIFAYVPDDCETSLVILNVTNNGDRTVRFDMDGYVLNEGYPNLCGHTYLCDGEDDTFPLMESILIKSGKNISVYYRSQDFDTYWVDDNTHVMFNFTYDSVKFRGDVTVNSGFSYWQRTTK
jgi:archaellum component FlaG (FlaF/FlaG flagellin family)